MFGFFDLQVDKNLRQRRRRNRTRATTGQYGRENASIHEAVSQTLSEPTIPAHHSQGRRNYRFLTDVGPRNGPEICKKSASQPTAFLQALVPARTRQGIRNLQVDKAKVPQTFQNERVLFELLHDRCVPFPISFTSSNSATVLKAKIKTAVGGASFPRKTRGRSQEVRRAKKDSTGVPR